MQGCKIGGQLREEGPDRTRKCSTNWPGQQRRGAIAIISDHYDSLNLSTIFLGLVDLRKVTGSGPRVKQIFFIAE